ncbi:DeoR/GlpR family DNA-binding transcription regulator [Paenibacillus sp. YN15]|uniref:DeoR/GlpR family DNA-binding transcription regulator n=1 Tax=Paenibacillus sp. YN15 TaxID=1742774 RepID=UPI000DCCC3D9|nr:DeoR/GlpR family DNA-binding transcription regulator [Paenibacillus sp. YN15]RAV06323.1 DeoR/GlpR transcriptional regulator [Paenibacillus sp. YN15]
MFAQQRHQAILEKIQEEKAIKASDLMELFGVSFETVRRDLELLEKAGRLRRVHGGAVLSQLDYTKELPLNMREAAYVEEKREVARIAARYVKEGMSIAMDASTTNHQLARLLKGQVSRLTVITNSLAIAQELTDMPGYRIILPGGVLHNEEQSIIGELAEQFTAMFHADLFFMSISGATLEEGITDYGIGEVQVKKVMLKNAKRAIALADSSKLGAVSLLKVCGADEVECLITDSGVDPEFVEAFRQRGIEVICK